MRKSVLFIVVMALLTISCADELNKERQPNSNLPTNATATPSVMETGREWRKVEVPLDRPADVITFGDQGQIAIAGQGILLLSLDSGQTWRSISEGKGNNMYTTDGKNFQNESGDRSISIAKLCSVETAVFSASGRLYLNTTCDHSSALWSVPTANVAHPWYVRSFAPSAEQFDKDGDYSSPGRNLVATSRRVLVDGKVSNETVLLTTEDEGATWQPMWRDPRATRIVGLDFSDEQNGWMLQANGKLLRTYNGGSTWVENSTLPATAAGRVVSLDFVDTTKGFVVGQQGLIFATTNGGKTWKQLTSNTQMALSHVAAVDENKAWVVGERGTLLETNDGGTSWRKHSLGFDDDIQAITVNNGVAWFVAGRSVYRSR